MNVQIKSELLRDIYLVLLTALMFALMFNLIAPFATTLLIALLLVASFQPLFKTVRDSTNKIVATIVSTLSVILLVALPIAFLSTVVINEIGPVFNKSITLLQETIENTDENSPVLQQVNSVIEKFNPDLKLNAEQLKRGLSTEVNRVGTELRNRLSDLLLPITQYIGGAFAQLIVFIFALVLFFRDFEQLPTIFKRYIPLSSDLEDTLLDEFLETGKSVLTGTFLVAALHALGIIFVMWVFGIEGLAILFMFIFIASLIPGGSQLIWVPVGIVVAFSSGVGFGIVFLLLCLVIMNLIDALIRPRLTTGGKTSVHPLLSLLSVLGGLGVYGIGGLIYGPLIAVLFLTLIEAYNQRFK